MTAANEAGRWRAAIDALRLTGARRLDRWLFWLIIVVGIVLPRATWLGVEANLDILGAPTLPAPFSSPFGGLVLLSPIALWWVSPYVGLALVWRFLFLRPSLLGTLYWETLIIVLGGLILGSLGTVKYLVGVFSDLALPSFLAMSLGLPLASAMFMAGGMVAGLVVVLPTFIVRLKRRSS